MPNPTCGRIVHYTIPAGPHMGRSRPLLVTSAADDVVSGHVFFEPLDHPHGLAPTIDTYGTGPAQVQLDQRRQVIVYVQHVHPGVNEPGTWHWPERSE